MKKIVLLLPLTYILLTACSGQGNQQDNGKENGDSIQAPMNNNLANIQGGPQTIKVNGGGQAPDIMTLLKAFQEAMPNEAVELVLKHGENLADGTQYEDEDDWRVLVDRKKGYADLASMTDCDQMQAAIWKKKDGHRIFAVSLFQQHGDPQDRLCWYDYNPDTETLTAEKSPVDDFKPDVKPEAIDWILPMNGTTFEIYEYHVGFPRITHQYTWDGQQFHPGKNLIDDFTNSFNNRTESGNPSGWNYYTIIDLTGAGSRVLWLSEDKNPKVSTLLTPFKGQMYSIAELTEQSVENSLACYKLPPQGKDKLPTVRVTYRDLPGGYWHTIMQGDYVSYVISDLPNFAEGGRSLDIEGFGADDETTDILDVEGEFFMPEAKQWHKFEFCEEAP